MIEQVIRYLVISDVHLGHDRNPTWNIVKNLLTFFEGFSDKSVFAKLDIIFIAGDLFDKLLDCSNSAIYDSFDFMVPLMRFCARHKIKLRSLEGTPGHERRQLRMFEMIKNIQMDGVDYKWIDTLHIEQMDDLGLSILYIPDEFTSSAKITQGMVEDLLREKNMQQVDIAIMHGLFEYQMQNIPGNHDVHNAQYYLGIVKHFINIGHNHNYSNYERIVSQGSFDRLTHGDEVPKGGCLMTIREDGHDHYQFLQNKDAMIFKTIELTDPDPQKSLQYLERILARLPNESHVRLKTSKFHPILSAYADIRRDWPFLHFSKLTFEEEEEQKVSEDREIEEHYNVVEIRPENVVKLIMEEVAQRVDHQFQSQQRLERLLENLQIT